MGSEQLGLVVFLALLLVIVVPAITTKRGGSFFGSLKLRPRQDRLPDTPERETAQTDRQTNGNRAELLDFMAALLRAATKNGLQLVCPATLEADGKTVRFAGLLVTPTEVLGVYCLGFGGRIYARAGYWEQLINGKKKEVPDYFSACKEWSQVGSAALEAGGLGHLRFRAVAVFTNRNVALELPANSVCFERERFLDRIAEQACGGGLETGINATARQLAQVVKKTDR